MSRIPTIHIAAAHVTIDGRYLRQRCAWCGAVLTDYDLTRVAVPADQPGPPATWPAGSLVAIDGNATWVVDAPDGTAPLPVGACALLDPAVTR